MNTKVGIMMINRKKIHKLNVDFLFQNLSENSGKTPEIIDLSLIIGYYIVIITHI